MMSWIFWTFALMLPLALAMYRRKRNGSLVSPIGKAVLITGCDSGIGLQAAFLLDRIGFVVFAGCLNPHGEGARALRRDASKRLVILDLDVTDQTKVDRVIALIREHCQLNSCGLWSLINNAGICIGGDLEWQTWSQCENQVSVNILGVIRMIKACLPLIKMTKGRIINISSVNGRLAYPGFTVYSATKFAIEGLSNGTRIELASSGVHVVVVAPGDYARLTNIMKTQQVHAKAQWENFSQNTRDEIGDYFWAMQSQMSELAGLTSPDSFKSSPLLVDLTQATMARIPNSRYVSTSVQYQIFFIICQYVPTCLLDRLLRTIRNRIFKSKKVSN